jgi:hypothetical protein
VQKIINFGACLRHNIRNQRRLVYHRVRALDTDRMLCEIDFFESREDSCTRGETIFTPRMYRLDIPCSHRVFLSQQGQESVDEYVRLPPGLEESFPDIDHLNGLEPIEEIHCRFTSEIFSSVATEQKNFQEREIVQLVDLIVKDVCGQKRRKEIRKFVKRKLPKSSSTAFALHETNGFWEVHNSGIKLFCAGSVPERKKRRQ